jgi:hypothetical protein
VTSPELAVRGASGFAIVERSAERGVPFAIGLRIRPRTRRRRDGAQGSANDEAFAGSRNAKVTRAAKLEG